MLCNFGFYIELIFRFFLVKKLKIRKGILDKALY